MKSRIFDKHFPTILGAGSVMEIWPTENYDRYMPDPIPENSLKGYWMNVNSYVCKGIVQYELDCHTRIAESLNDE